MAQDPQRGTGEPSVLTWKNLLLNKSLSLQCSVCRLLGDMPAPVGQPPKVEDLRTSRSSPFFKGKATSFPF